ncbi:MAG TPA: LysM peptidoglycan-binding domain-containing protein [Phototrophicaceae bacterium]|nr:LysM peptidoglycan-binding domain-containing protein [Phototrophicaceae bacterium]
MFRWVALLAALLLILSAVSVSAADTPTATPVPDTSSYQVRSGDTLGSIAAHFHTTIGAIMRLNKLADPQLVVLGQTLLIPASTETPASTEVPAGTTTLIAPATAEVTPAVTAEIPAVTPTFDYGIEAFFDNQDVSSVVQQITSLGMQWTKVRVEWRDLEPSKGSIDYTHLDAVIDALQAAQLNVLLTVTDAPDWARSSHLENGPPDDFSTYVAFIGALAAHYAGKVRAYEIWNEPNLRREWNSTVHPLGAASYADLLRGAYAAVKAADASAAVVSAGLAPTGFDDGVNAIDDRQFLSDLYANGLASISDAVGAHPFGFANPPDAVCCQAPAGVASHYGHPSFYFLDTLNDYHNIMVMNGDTSKLIWVTQFGWGSSEDTSSPPPDSIYFSYTSLAQQAAYIPRAFELGAKSQFVGMMILYNLNACTVQPENYEACYYSLIAPSGQSRPVFNTLSMIFSTAVQR